MSLPMTPNPTADVDDELVNRRLARAFGTAARDDEADAAFGITDERLDAMAKARRAQLATIAADPAYDPFEQDRDEDLYGF